MKLPGPDHPITVARNPKRVQVRFAGETIADTTRALTLEEAGYRPVQYIPRADVRMDLLRRTTHRTACPYKGEASYFSIFAHGKLSENAAWSYEAPFSAVKEIAGHLAFYPSKVEKIEETAL